MPEDAKSAGKPSLYEGVRVLCAFIRQLLPCCFVLKRGGYVHALHCVHDCQSELFCLETKLTLIVNVMEYITFRRRLVLKIEKRRHLYIFYIYFCRLEMFRTRAWMQLSWGNALSPFNIREAVSLYWIINATFSVSNRMHCVPVIGWKRKCQGEVKYKVVDASWLSKRWACPIWVSRHVIILIHCELLVWHTAGVMQQKCQKVSWLLRSWI